MSNRCTYCSLIVYPLEQVKIGPANNFYHKSTCLKCSKCKRTITATNYVFAQGELYCEVHKPSVVNKPTNNSNNGIDEAGSGWNVALAAKASSSSMSNNTNGSNFALVRQVSGSHGKGRVRPSTLGTGLQMSEYSAPLAKKHSSPLIQMNSFTLRDIALQKEKGKENDGLEEKHSRSMSVPPLSEIPPPETIIPPSSTQKQPAEKLIDQQLCNEEIDAAVKETEEILRSVQASLQSLDIPDQQFPVTADLNSVPPKHIFSKEENSVSNTSMISLKTAMAIAPRSNNAGFPSSQTSVAARMSLPANSVLASPSLHALQASLKAAASITSATGAIVVDDVNNSKAKGFGIEDSFENLSRNASKMLLSTANIPSTSRKNSQTPNQQQVPQSQSSIFLEQLNDACKELITFLEEAQIKSSFDLSSLDKERLQYIFQKIRETLKEIGKLIELSVISTKYLSKITDELDTIEKQLLYSSSLNGSLTLPLLKSKVALAEKIASVLCTEWEMTKEGSIVEEMAGWRIEAIPQDFTKNQLANLKTLNSGAGNEGNGTMKSSILFLNAAMQSTTTQSSIDVLSSTSPQDSMINKPTSDAHQGFNAVDLGQFAYRVFFLGSDHRNYIYVDEKSGTPPIFISIKKEGINMSLPRAKSLERAAGDGEDEDQLGLMSSSFNNNKSSSENPLNDLQFKKKQDWISNPNFTFPTKQSFTDLTSSNDSVFFRIILRTKDSFTDQRVLLPSSLAKSASVHRSLLSTKSSDFKDALTALLPQLQPKKLKRITQSKFPLALCKMDELALFSEFKIGILYCKKGQVTESEMFSNEHGSPSFNEFLSIMGDKVELLNYANRFTGGLDTKNNNTGQYSVSTQIGCFDIMFHVSTLLPFSSEDPQQIQRKRHIGNDIVCIVFVDEEEDEGIKGENGRKWIPNLIKSQFLHIFIVVQKTALNGPWKVNVISNSDVPLFPPALPTPALFSDPSVLRAFILEKCINGECSAYRAPKLSGPLRRTRGLLFDEAVKTFYYKDIQSSSTSNLMSSANVSNDPSNAYSLTSTVNNSIMSLTAQRAAKGGIGNLGSLKADEATAKEKRSKLSQIITTNNKA